MKPLHAIVSATILSAGVVGCEEPLSAEYFLAGPANRIQTAAEKNLPKPKKPLPPKEKTVYNYSKIRKDNGDYVIEKRTKVIKDFPPEIEEVEPRLGCFKIKVRNEGLNGEHFEYIAVIDLERGVVRKRNKHEFYTFDMNCYYDTGWKDEEGTVEEGTVFPKSCSLKKILCFDRPTEPGTYKYAIEVKDHYHTVRSDPITIRIEEAK